MNEICQFPFSPELPPRILYTPIHRTQRHTHKQPHMWTNLFKIVCLNLLMWLHVLVPGLCSPCFCPPHCTGFLASGAGATAKHQKPRQSASLMTAMLCTPMNYRAIWLSNYLMAKRKRTLHSLQVATWLAVCCTWFLDGSLWVVLFNFFAGCSPWSWGEQKVDLRPVLFLTHHIHLHSNQHAHAQLHTHTYACTQELWTASGLLTSEFLPILLMLQSIFSWRHLTSGPQLSSLVKPLEFHYTSLPVSWA